MAFVTDFKKNNIACQAYHGIIFYLEYCGRVLRRQAKFHIKNMYTSSEMEVSYLTLSGTTMRKTIGANPLLTSIYNYRNFF